MIFVDRRLDLRRTVRRILPLFLPTQRREIEARPDGTQRLDTASRSKITDNFCVNVIEQLWSINLLSLGEIRRENHG